MEISRKAAIGAACLTLAAAVLPGCGKYEASERDDLQSVPLAAQPWNDLGDGLYSFNFDETWPASLAKFKQDNPELTITAMYSDTPCVSGSSDLHSHGVVVVTTPSSSIFPAVLRERAGE